MEAADGARVGNADVSLQNQDLNFIRTPVAAFLSDYGWYLLFLGVGVYLLMQHLNKKRSRGTKSQTVSEGTQDPSSVARHQEALEVARQRMQEELNARAEEFKEKQKRLEEEKSRQKIEMWESVKEGKSFKGNARVAHNTEEASTSSSSSTALKPKTDRRLRTSGYNPLSGGGGGTCGWRPGRRGPSAGG